MSRTIRSKYFSQFVFRHPKSKNEKSKLNEILSDPDFKDFPLSKANRIQARAGNSGELPTAYDDIIVSSYRESRYNK